MSSKMISKRYNAKILRELISAPGNRNCMDCDQPLPQLVNLTHCTFVCFACGGMLREFHFRVQSISQTEFSNAQLRNLVQAGGNLKARKLFHGRSGKKFRNWQTPQTPQSQNALREYVRKTYVDRIRYTPLEKTEIPSSKLPKARKSVPTLAAPKHDKRTRAIGRQTSVSVTSTSGQSNGYIDLSTPTNQSLCRVSSFGSGTSATLSSVGSWRSHSASISSMTSSLASPTTPSAMSFDTSTGSAVAKQPQICVEQQQQGQQLGQQHQQHQQQQQQQQLQLQLQLQQPPAYQASSYIQATRRPQQPYYQPNQGIDAPMYNHLNMAQARSPPMAGRAGLVYFDERQELDPFASIHLDAHKSTHPADPGFQDQMRCRYQQQQQHMLVHQQQFQQMGGAPVAVASSYQRQQMQHSQQSYV